MRLACFGSCLKTANVRTKPDRVISLKKGIAGKATSREFLFGCSEKQIFVATEKDIMKSFLLALILATAALSASAQKTQSIDSPTLKNREDSTTINGLPVHKSYVAPDVVERAKKKYGRSLYSIEKSTAPDCQNSYLVCIILNCKLFIE